jgi:hypothetical protein
MLSKLRTRLTYANVTATVALFLALGGGSAYAVNEWTGANIRNETLTGADVKGCPGVDGTLTGLDLKNGSVQRPDLGVSARDACPVGTTRLGRICARSPNTPKKWVDATSYCSSLGPRLPSPSEALTMASNYSVPGVAPGEAFWTDNVYADTSGLQVYYVNGGGASGVVSTEATYVDVVCVTTPVN